MNSLVKHVQEQNEVFEKHRGDDTEHERVCLLLFLVLVERAIVINTFVFGVVVSMFLKHFILFVRVIHRSVHLIDAQTEIEWFLSFTVNNSSVLIGHKASFFHSRHKTWCGRV